MRVLVVDKELLPSLKKEDKYLLKIFKIDREVKQRSGELNEIR